jgi:hypothetical protein
MLNKEKDKSNALTKLKQEIQMDILRGRLRRTLHYFRKDVLQTFSKTVIE